MKYFLLILIICVACGVDGQNCSKPQALDTLNINNVSAIVKGGSIMWDWDSWPIQHEIPKGGGASIAESGSLVFTAKDQYGKLYSSFDYYDYGYDQFAAGPVNNQNCSEFDTIWKVYATEIDAFRNDWSDGILDDPIPLNILHWPGQGNNNNTTNIANGGKAHFTDSNINGIYEPHLGEYPVLNSCGRNYADQMLWYSFNDSLSSHIFNKRLGVEVESTSYAYQSDDHINNTVFYDYNITYMGTRILDSAYFGLWVDVDLGYWNDDLIGIDTSRNLAIWYNGENEDFLYGSDLPLAGLKIIKNTLRNNSNKLITSMTAEWDSDNCNCWDNPVNSEEIYNQYRGYWTCGEPIRANGIGCPYPWNNGPTTRYLYPGDPTNPNEWSECTEQNLGSERRIMLSLGGVRLEPGDQHKFTMAMIWVRDSIPHPCPSFQPIQEVADFVQNWYEDNICNDPINVGITEMANLKSSVFPNPFSNQSTLSFPQEMKSEKSVHIYNEIGQLVKSDLGITEPNLRIEGDDLGKGIFIYKVSSKEGQSVGKFIVN